MMVVYFAIKGVYEGDRPDPTCAQLIQLIAQNCHGIVTDREMKRRYDRHVSGLFAEPQYQVPTALFLADFVFNPQKFIIETSDPTEIPTGAIGDVPREDVYVVRAGLISLPIIVTAEKRLLNGINKNRDALGLTALTPAEAIELARDS